jgi:hypothetical protein
MKNIIKLSTIISISFFLFACEKESEISKYNANELGNIQSTNQDDEKSFKVIEKEEEKSAYDKFVETASKRKF